MVRLIHEAVAQRAADPRVRRWCADLAFCIALVALVWVAYTPSQKHPPRADHWCFLVDTMKTPRAADAIAASYSYNRTRLISPGDTDLFRPVLFALLATEQSLFAGDLWVYQTIGMILHCAVCLLLLALLRQIAALAAEPRTGVDPLAYAITAFFALNPAVQELVIWSHLHGYLLFLALLFASIVLLLQHANGPAAGKWNSPALWGSWSIAVVAAFTYEMGQFYAVLGGLFLGAAVYPRAGLGRAVGLFVFFASILPAYQAVNKYDLECHRGKYVPDNAHGAIREKILTRATLSHSVRFALYTGVQPVYPTLLQASEGGGRLNVMETIWDGYVLKRCGPVAVAGTAILLIAAGFAALGLFGMLWRGNRLPLLTVLLMAGLYAVYAAMTVLGRMNLRPGPPMLTSNSYYAYPALVLLLPLVYAAGNAVGRTANGLAATARSGMAVGLVALALVGGDQVRRVNIDMAKTLNGTTRPLRAVNLFVRDHRADPDFSIGIDYEASDHVPKVYGLWVTDVIFYRYLSATPKYWIAIREGRAVVLPGPSGPRAAEPVAVERTTVRVGGLASRPANGDGDGLLD